MKDYRLGMIAGQRSDPAMPSKDSPRKPTINDVAAAAGVSRGTVSRAMNGGRWVSESAMKAVQDAVSATGYRANPHATSLKTRRTGTIALLISESVQRLFSDPNFPLILQALEEELDSQGRTLIMLLASTTTQRQRADDLITNGLVDGVMLVSWANDLAFARRYAEAGVPVISCGPINSPRDRRLISSVGADDRDGSYQATRHLLDQGRTRIALICGPQGADLNHLRFAGYQQAMGTVDLDLVRIGDLSRPSGATAVTSLLEAGVSYDGIFAHNDAMAVGAMDVLRREGMRVPDDVAVVGYDDNELARTATPALTTVRHSFERLAREMCRLLAEQLDGEAPAHVVLPTELVVRDSA